MSIAIAVSTHEANLSNTQLTSGLRAASTAAVQAAFTSIEVWVIKFVFFGFSKIFLLLATTTNEKLKHMGIFQHVTVPITASGNENDTPCDLRCRTSFLALRIGRLV